MLQIWFTWILSIRHVTILKPKVIFSSAQNVSLVSIEQVVQNLLAFRATNAFCSNTVKQAPHDANNTLNLIDSNNNKKKL